MNKDVIYIDAEDDVTAIIGKIKASHEKIVALVPPKHVGILQSAVNLRLLQRMATNANKRMVLITNNQALIALSAVANIPVAKNLQTKPEVAQIPVLSIDDGEDIIDGSQLPIGELVKTADRPDGNDIPVNSFNIDDKPVAVSALGAAVKKMNRPKNGVKVPNFNTFRKKLFIGMAAAAVLIGFFIWATWFAPGATVIITARTTPMAVDANVTLAGNAATDVSKGLIQSSIQQTKKDVSVDFDATGTKNVGEKATGTVNFSSNSFTPQTVPAGTQLQTSGGLVFVTTSAVSVPSATFPCNNASCALQGSASGAVTSSVGGTSYNGATGSLSGGPDSVSASFASPSAGGTDKTVAIVTADDVQKANADLVQQSSDPAVKAQLIKQFPANQVVIDNSFTTVPAVATSVPAVGAEATGKAKLTSSTTYTITAIAKSDLEIYLAADLNKQLVGKSNQRMYNDGISKVVLTSKPEAANIVIIHSTGQVGPKIDEAAIKQQVKGKIYGEVQSTLVAINGVDNVDVKFSFFWVHTVPNDVNRIKVEFKLQNG